MCVCERERENVSVCWGGGYDVRLYTKLIILVPKLASTCTWKLLYNP